MASSRFEPDALLIVMVYAAAGRPPDEDVARWSVPTIVSVPEPLCVVITGMPDQKD